MTEQTELGRFLRARREGIRPEEVGLRTATGIRRTPGLRREELATLAGVSIDYYTRLERGRETRPGPAVVDTLAAALRLDAEEHAFLRDLVDRAGRRAPKPPRRASGTVRPTVALLLETMRPHPAYLLGRTNDVLAANPAGWRLLPGLWDWPAGRRNTIRYTFLHPAARTLWPDWEQKAKGCVAQLRAVMGSDPDDDDLVGLVGELIVKSPEFNRFWARYEVRRSGWGRKTYLHPEAGVIDLDHEVLPLEGSEGQRVVVHLARPGTPAYDAVKLLDMADPSADPRADPRADPSPDPRAEVPMAADPRTARLRG